MTWTYSQTTGELTHNGTFQGTGYSGTGDGRNNPDMQNVQAVGPLPQGTYTIGGAYQHPHLGPCVMNLDPKEGTETFGRSLFRIHGDNAAHNASHGCVILGPAIRHAIADSDDNNLVVTV
jgi:hypothetical protein